MSTASKKRNRKTKARHREAATRDVERAIASKDPAIIYEAAFRISRHEHGYNHVLIKPLEDAIIETQSGMWIWHFAKGVKKADKFRLLTVAHLYGYQVTAEEIEEARQVKGKTR